ncbi:family 20 glycosylhydrolase [Shewanella holmiensis]|uniref:beta-N-acetylhexosaminidase n=1 Tax=Shewanella holmiensis TaxID=2952222 RepID=A0A9X2WKZ1_9GAMM|nr:family 20 glycosylhydrolase [Shewanella holmiensis]MCT7941190.1 carbohydate-binding domain-containing protein [Shewanella holmiensis]
MKTTWALSAIMMSLSLTACSPSQSTVSTTTSATASWQQSHLAEFADQLIVKYRLVSNLPEEACPADAKADERCFIAEIDFTSPKDMLHGDWEIYFSQMRPIQTVLNDEFVIERVKGDLHRLTPTDKFGGFKAGQVKTVRFRGELWQLSETDFMPNYYIVAKDANGIELAPQIISSTRVEIDADTGMEVRPYVEAFVDAKRQYQRTDKDKLVWAKSGVLFEQNKAVSVAPALIENSLLPTPQTQVLLENVKAVSLSQGITLDTQSFTDAKLNADDIQAALARLERIGVPQSENGVKVSFAALSPVDNLKAGSYQLTVADSGIVIKASEPSGFSYAIASITSLVDVNDLTINAMKIDDSPRYQYRGMHVDVSRNFHSKQFLLDLLDQMAAYKLNKLHLHMGDDEGWRLEINGLPELTDIGSNRCHDITESSCILPQLGSGPFVDTKVNGYYTKADYIDIIQYADARQIQVIPSMDMPGHSRAAIKSMDARYRNLMAKGDEQAAKEFLLTDPNDTTQYSSVQYYDDNTLNVCMESTYHFVDKVITEIAALHTQAGQPLTTYHIGADETAGAWLESPICHDFIANNQYGVTDIKLVGPYFIERVANMLAEKGIQPAGWSDGMSHTNPDNMPSNSQSNVWDVVSHKGYQRAHQQVNNGWTTILSNPEVLYFDFPYEADPKEHGYYWASRGLNSKHIFSFMPGNLPANAEQWLDIEGNPFEADDRPQVDENGKQTSGPIVAGKTFDGIQGQLWSETLRSDQTVEYMIYPRLLMLAERAWNKPEWEVPYQYDGAVYNQSTQHFSVQMRQQQATDWQKMANHLGHKELAKLDKAGIEYRVPTVGAIIDDKGVLTANIAFPGLQIEYKEQGKAWQTYLNPVAVEGQVEVRAITPDGKRKGRTLVVN